MNLGPQGRIHISHNRSRNSSMCTIQSSYQSGVTGISKLVSVMLDLKGKFFFVAKYLLRDASSEFRFFSYPY